MRKVCIFLGILIANVLLVLAVPNAPAAASVGSLASKVAVSQVTSRTEATVNSEQYTHELIIKAQVRQAALIARRTAYSNPLRHIHALLPERIDMGVDYGGYGYIYPLGRGVIVNVYNGGWPSGVFICEKLVTGRLRGRYVYYSESITPRVYVGQHVTRWTRLGYMWGGIEVGWAEPPPMIGNTMAMALGESYFPTAEGRKFSWLLHHLGAPAGIG